VNDVDLPLVVARFVITDGEQNTESGGRHTVEVIQWKIDCCEYDQKIGVYIYKMRFKLDFQSC
jgi:hypothetical protein